MVGMTSPRRPHGWRWVAHPPWRTPLPVPLPPRPRARTGAAWGDRTPSYPATPRWGLPPVVAPRPEPPRRSGPGPTARLAGTIRWLLPAARGWLAGAAAAHLLRYAVLAWYSDRLAPWWVEAVTTALVWVAGAVALAVGLLAAVATTAWLVTRRRAAYAPERDPRRRIELWAGSLLPVVTYLRTPVYLEELRRAAAGASRAPARAPTVGRLRRWWAAWVVNGLAVALAVWRGTADGPQAAADTVLLTALALATAAWVATETLAVTRSFGDPLPRFTRRFLVRGIVDASPAREESP